MHKLININTFKEKTMAMPTAAEITNLYLYGTKTVPSDLTSEALTCSLNTKTTQHI
jgi:hypothetical protein